MARTRTVQITLTQADRRAIERGLGQANLQLLYILSDLGPYERTVWDGPQELTYTIPNNLALQNVLTHPDFQYVTVQAIRDLV